MKKGIVVHSRGGRREGVTTGGERPCGQEGCRHKRVGVRWLLHGNLTFPCLGGIKKNKDGSLELA